MNNIFRALQYRNFRLFFIGQGVSVVGTWMQAIAMSWLVYRMTNSPFLLGLVGFLSQIPAFLFGPFAGVIVDRFNRHRILILTQILSMIQAFLLAALTLSGRIEVWHIILLGFLLGCINSLDIPARQTFVIEMVERKENLANAIALNSFLFNSARLIGPSIAGVIIALLGEGICFLVNGLSFLAVIAALTAMKVGPLKTEGEKRDILADIKEGFGYAYNFLPIRYILMLLGVISVMGMSYAVLMPVFAKDILGGGPGTFGTLMASGGVGAIAATIYLASRKSIVGLGDMIPVFATLFSIGIIVFSISRALWFSLVVLAATGFGMMAYMAASNIIIQTVVDDDKRGRVMGFYMMTFIGLAPFGSLLAGSLASRIGATNTLIAGGIICILASIAFAAKVPLLRKTIHPIYRKIGIIPEVAQGIGAASSLIVPPED
ncbi:MAG: MFS transporter [Candidatus Omnitrophica bacterium]|nr:MFS transporter [Candidatus Omnitrophota bacterium]